MKRNIPRMLAWLLLICGLAGPGAARLGHPIPASVLRWLITAGAALMIISFFWFPRRTEGRAAAQRPRAGRRRPAAAARDAVAVEGAAPSAGRRARGKR